MLLVYYVRQLFSSAEQLSDDRRRNRATRQSTPTTGQIRDEILTFQQNGHESTTLVGSPAWFTWLQSATSFTFEDKEGHFTAHKTSAGNRRGGFYWRASRRRGGRLFSFYLGKSSRLTLQHLCEAARQLRGDSPATEEPSTHLASGHSSSREPAPTPVDPLLVTKLSLPRLSVQHIARPHLLALVEQCVQRPVTLISAPAGSGKTTLLAEWARTTALSTSWLSWEDADNDPARFLSYLTAALTHLSTPSVSIEPHYEGSPDHSWKHRLTDLLNALAQALQADAVVILDDLHLLTSEAILPVLQFLLDHLPAHLHLMIGTRTDPPFSLARLRAYNQLSEVRAEDLSFTPIELAAFVRAMGLNLEPEALHLLEVLAEGWVAGIQLLTLALRGQVDATAFLRGSGSAHRFLLEYVREDVLNQQTPEMQYFLLHTCVLERFTGSLCDAVTQQTHGYARLEELRRANLFVSELDGAQHWYRYHPLFAESLRAQLSEQEPDCIADLYRRASFWYAEQGWDEEACEYALRAGDLQRAATLLEQLLPRLLGQGKFLSLDRWFSQLPPSLIATFPLLSIASLVRTYMHARNILKPQNAEQSLQMVIAYLNQQIQVHAQEAESRWLPLQAGLPLLQALTAWNQGDLARTLSLAHAISPVPVQSDNSLDQMIIIGRQALLGIAYGASGNFEAAEQNLLNALFIDLDSSPSPFNIMTGFVLIDLYEARGQLRKLKQLYERLFLAFEPRRNEALPLLALAQLRFAGLLYEWNRLEEAGAALQKAVVLGRNLEVSMPGVALLGRSVEARIALLKTDKEQARHLLEKEFALWPELLEQQAIRALGAFPARVALACGELPLAEQWERASNFHLADLSELRLSLKDFLPYVTLVRILLARGSTRHNQPSLAQALLLLDRLRDVVRKADANGCLLEIEILTALGLRIQGKTRRALQALGAVLEQAEREGYVRLFADEGQPMAYLLAQVKEYTSASPGYIKLLQAAISFPDPPISMEAAPSQSLLDPLSERELEVLSLLADGLSNQQIAQRLVISLHTVKLHVKHILSKLTATNRTQAVSRARSLHLL